MADADGAIQKDVPSNGLETPNGEPKERPPSARDEAMALIEANRMALLEQESGVKFDVAEPVTDTKADDEAAKKKADEEAAALSARKQIKEQTEDLILDADTIGRSKVRVKIDGEEQLVDAGKALAQYQKGAAADVRLADATRLQREAAADRAAAATERAEAGKRTEKAADPTPVTADAAKKKFQEAADALYRSEPEEAATLFAEAVAAATPQPVQSAVTAATPLNQEEVINAVEQRLSQKGALTKLFTDYPEISADQDLQVLADRYVAAHTQNGLSVPDAIAKAGEQLGEKYKLGRFKDPLGRPLKTDAPTTREQKLAGKAAIDEIPANAARASETAPEPETPSQLIAEMQAARERQAQPARRVA